jgi:hypothetical protein
MYPFYDEDLNMLYITGKGDGNIRYFEFLNNKLNYLTEYRAPSSGKAYGFYPKKCVDVGKNEVMCALKATNDTLE